MGLFGPKLPKEEKNYQKALKDVLHKPNTKNVNEMKSALKSYPNGWQGYWICAVFHDQGFDKSVRDEAKAQEYFQKAENAARGTNHEVWMQEFLKWYLRDAGHLKKTMTEEEERFRRLGVALCYCYLLGDKFLVDPYEKYGGDGYVMSRILSQANVDYDEIRSFADFVTVPTFDRNEQVKATNKYFEQSTKTENAYAKITNLIKEGKEPNWDKYHDMYDYFIAVNCIHGGDLLTGEVAENSYVSEIDMGISRFIYLSVEGCQPAIHELVRLAKGSQANFEVVERCFSNKKLSSLWGGNLDYFLAEKLKECIEKKDVEAKNLYQLYY